MSDLKQKIEALLFVAGKPVSFRDIAKFSKVMIPGVKTATQELLVEYENSTRGVQLVVKDEEAQLVSHGEAREITESYLKEDIEGNLSRAALETLAIIAYRSPITRPEIDFIRGVNSTIMLRNLLMRGLVNRCKSKKDARMFEYEMSIEFLKLMGVSKPQDLPDYEELIKSEAMQMVEKNMKEQTVQEIPEDNAEEKKALDEAKKEKSYSVPINIIKDDTDQ